MEREQLMIARDVLDGLIEGTVAELKAPPAKWKLSDRSALELVGVHPDLQAVALPVVGTGLISRALTRIDFTIMLPLSRFPPLIQNAPR